MANSEDEGDSDGSARQTSARKKSKSPKKNPKKLIASKTVHVPKNKKMFKQ